MFQSCYNGVKLIDGAGPCPANAERIDLGAAPMIARMMQTGLMVDLDHFARMEKDLIADMDRITEEVRDLTGYYINLDSGDQVSDLLFKKLGIKQPRVKMTKSGDRESVEHAVLLAIQHEHPAVPKILDYKEFSKLLGTYVRPIPKLAVKITSGEYRLFPRLGQSRVPAGRLNAKDPNLLAMPSRTERGREIRKGFIARPGWKYLSVDLSQIEPRVAAHRSKDPGLIRVYCEQEDIYSDFATAAFRLKDERYRDDSGKWKYPGVDAMEHRRPSKICILAALYDVTNVGLLEQMPVICATCNLPATEHTCKKFRSYWNEQNCQDLLNSFYMKYPELLRMRKKDHATARKNAFVWCPWGRILHVAAVRSVLDWVVSQALREVGNFPMSSGAQGVIKLAMAQLEDEFVQMGLYGDVADILLQVHDELLYEIREEHAEEIGIFVKDRFEGVVRLDVPLKAGVAVADSFGLLDK